MMELWFPVAMQWNFWLTRVISVFGEPGFAVVHRRWDDDLYCGAGPGLCDNDDTDFEFVFWGGGGAGHVAISAGNGMVYSTDVRQPGKVEVLVQREHADDLVTSAHGS